MSVSIGTISFSGIRFLRSSLFLLLSQEEDMIDRANRIIYVNLIIEEDNSNIKYSNDFHTSLFRNFLVRNLTGYQAAQYPIRSTVDGTIIKSFNFITTG